MIPPVDFKLDNATIEYLRDDLQGYVTHLDRNGRRDEANTVIEVIERMESAARTYGVTS